MKKLFILLLIIMLFSCGTSNKIQFCEGMSKDGDGVNCGEKFEAGDLTALIMSEGPFDADSIEVEVYRLERVQENKTDTITSQVQPRDTKATVSLSFLKGGLYRVKAKKGGSVFSQGEIEIVDQ